MMKDDEKSQSESADGRKRKSSLEKEQSQEGKTFSLQINQIKKSKKTDGVLPKKTNLSSVFNEESDSEEEMPLECKMKMRNVGRDTITSSGPNSYNKGKKGFTKNAFKQFELSMKPRNSMEKQNEPMESKR